MLWTHLKINLMIYYNINNDNLFTVVKLNIYFYNLISKLWLNL